MIGLSLFAAAAAMSPDVALGRWRTETRNGIVEVGGPETFSFDEAIRRSLAALDDPRTVVADPSATY